MRRAQNNTLIRKSRDYAARPGDTAWVRLESRLSDHRKSRSLMKIRLLSAAAVMILLVSFLFVYRTDAPAKDTGMSTLAALSVEDSQGDGIYDVSKLSQLKLAYSKIQRKNGL